MVKPQDKVTTPTIECPVCKKRVPASTAVSPESEEYMLHFCGGECRAQWEREQARTLEQAFEEKSGVKRG